MEKDGQWSLFEDGGRRTFPELMKRHEAALSRFVHARIADVDTAEDIICETWATAWAKRDCFEGRRNAKFFTWVCGIALNHLRKEWRRRKPECRAEIVTEAVVQLAFDDLFCDEILDAVRRTSEGQHVALRLNLDGWSGPEAARHLGITLDAYKSMLTRSRFTAQTVYARTY